MAYDPVQQSICMYSGFKYPITELVKDWQGLLVHRRFVDKRNPQDFVRGVKDGQPPLRSSPEPEDTFITSTVLPSDL